MSTQKQDRSAGRRRSAGPALTRRAFALGGAGAALAATATGASAQSTNWWDSVFGNAAPRYAPPARSSETAPPQLDDLRPGEVPMRSDVMVESMERAIGMYQQIASRGGWPAIPGPRMMRPGDDDERVPLLRRRLAAGGELRPRYGFDQMSYDGELEAAVRRFQQRHGLRVSGRVDQPTLAALNVPAAARLGQLRLNLQRIKELSSQRIEDKYVLVNIPGFQLEAVERHKVEQRHRVIVGKPSRESPSVKATIRALNFFPYWRVPDSVATLDLIPRLQKEPDYLHKEQIRVLAGNFNGHEIDSSAIDWRTADARQIKFRQDPGPQNALGLVRIDMPNEHGVYMHDTPMKKLFEQRGRSFSAGCVRVQDVFQLVLWIGRDEPGFDKQKMDEVLAGGIGYDVTLTRPIPVYFTYITAWAETDGQVEFRPDLYNRDGHIELAAGRDRDPSDPAPVSEMLAP
jgi:murein L,D-transpeptidase YcbB/YkuD